MAKEKKVKNPDDKLPIGRFLAWRMRDWSVAASFMIINTYLTIYCTDTMKMPPLLVGTLLMFSKVLDAVGEMFAGILVDNTNTKLGRGRPWELCLIGLWLSQIALFSIPADASMTVKSIWLFVTYALTQSIFQTMLQAAQLPYMVRAFKNKTVMTKLQSYGGILGTILAMTVSVSFPRLMKTIATSPAGWTKLVAMYGIPLMLVGLLRFFFVKEDVKIENEDKEEKVTFTNIIQLIRTNKYVWIILGITLALQMIQGMGASSYYFKYIVGDIGKYGSLQVLTIAILPLMALFPMLIKKFSLSQVVGFGALIGFVGYFLNFFAAGNMTMLTIGFVLSGLSALAPSYLMGIMIYDVVTYSSYKGFPRMDGTVSAFNNFGSNAGSAIGSFLMGALLHLTGYVGEAATQNPASMFMIRASYSLIPALLCIAMFVLAKMFTKLEKQIPQIEAEMKAKNQKENA